MTFSMKVGLKIFHGQGESSGRRLGSALNANIQVAMSAYAPQADTATRYSWHPLMATGPKLSN